MFCVTRQKKMTGEFEKGEELFEWIWPTATGECMDADCEDQTDAEKAAGATCKLTQETKDKCTGDDKKLIVAFSQCDYVKPQEPEDNGCENLIVTQEKIDGKGEHIEGTDPKEYQPYF